MVMVVYDRKFLLSNAMDNTLRQWDVRPFVTGSRQVKVYQGATVRIRRMLCFCFCCPACTRETLSI